MKRLTLALVTIALLFVVFGICRVLGGKKTNWEYSPLDSYVKAVNKNYQDSIKSRNDAKLFLDSINKK